MTGARTREVAEGEADLRVDRWFRRHFPDLAHGQVEKLLRTGQIRIDGRRARANSRLVPGQTIRIPPVVDEPDPDREPRVHAPSEREAAELRRRVLYSDAEFIVIDKPAGLPVQGGSGTVRHLDAMLDALRFGAPERPRLVHRLDKDTSGALVLARSAAAAAKLAKAFRERALRKIYWAFVVGVPAAERGRIDIPLSKLPGRASERVMPDEDGQKAITCYRVVERIGRKACWLALMPLTGRTHQLRAHCAAIGTPILGDGKYGGEKAILPGYETAGQLHLHAREIDLPLPRGGFVRVAAPLPPHMAATWRFFELDPDARDDAFADLDLKTVSA